MFIKHSARARLPILIAYVDDIILTGNDEEEIKMLKADMSRELEVKKPRANEILLRNGGGTVK